MTPITAQHTRSAASSRIVQIDSLRGFAIFLVILGHSVLVFPVNMLENYYCQLLHDLIYSFHMPLFFMIAGYCYSCRDYRSYVKRKFMRLMLPYIAFNVIDMIPRYLLAAFFNHKQTLTESITKMIFHGGAYWFIYTLFIMFMIYPFIHALVRSSRTKMIMLAVILFVLQFVKTGITLFDAERLIHNLFYFHLGVIVREMFGTSWPQIRFHTPLLAASAVLWLLLFSVKSAPETLTALAGIMMCFFMTYYEGFNRFFARFSPYSLQLYLLNGFTLGMSRVIICNVLHVPSYAAILAFNVLIDFFASYLFIRYVCSRFKTVRLIMGM